MKHNIAEFIKFIRPQIVFLFFLEIYQKQLNSLNWIYILPIFEPRHWTSLRSLVEHSAAYVSVFLFKNSSKLLQFCILLKINNDVLCNFSAFFVKQ